MASLKIITNVLKKNKQQSYTISSRKIEKGRMPFSVHFMKLVILHWYPDQREKKETTGDISHEYRCFPHSSVGKKNLPAMWETWVWSLGWEDSPGEGKGYPLQYSCLENSMGLQRVGYNWASFTFIGAKKSLAKHWHMKFSNIKKKRNYILWANGVYFRNARLDQC